MYIITLIYENWHKRLYFRSTSPGDTSGRFNDLLQKVGLIGVVSTSMSEYCGRVTALFYDVGFVRIQK